MSSLIPFSFESREIRSLIIDGNPWFVAKDVAEALGYKDTVNALKLHCRGVAKHHPIVDSLGRTQEVRIIHEPDTYRLIVGSHLPEAERFERWLFEEVLPSIRKTGGYSLPGAPPKPDPAVLAQQLADLLQGTVLVDYDTLSLMIRTLRTIHVLAEDVLPAVADALESWHEWHEKCDQGQPRPPRRAPRAAPAPTPPRIPARMRAKGEVLPPLALPPVPVVRQSLDQALLNFITQQQGQGAGHRVLYHGCWPYRQASPEERLAALQRLLDQGAIVRAQPLSKPGARHKVPVYVAMAFAPAQAAQVASRTHPAPRARRARMETVA